MVHSKMLLFANQAFDVMKSSFPWELLLDWWTVLLKNICRRVTASEFERLAPQFLQLSIKLGNLLLYHKQYHVAEDILQFADQCILEDFILAVFFATCKHPQADSYTAMLQALMKVYEEDGLVHRALEVRERLHHCFDLAPVRNLKISFPMTSALLALPTCRRSIHRVETLILPCNSLMLISNVLAFWIKKWTIGLKC